MSADLRTTLIVAAALLVVIAGIAALLTFVGAFTPAAEPAAETPGTEPTAAAWAPPAEPPVAATDPGRGIASRVDADWVAETAAATGIPERALAAYAGAALWKASQMPECGLSWNLLAGIAATESDHGRHAGSSVGLDGTVAPPIFGVALDGDGNVLIEDSDDGTLDGDAGFDRAVGPFQLIPQTWRNWHVDGNRDGVEDPQNIDDAAVATVNYLCRASTALDTEAGWRAAVAAFNSPPSYLESVASYANAYAEAVG